MNVLVPRNGGPLKSAARKTVVKLRRKIFTLYGGEEKARTMLAIAIQFAPYGWGQIKKQMVNQMIAWYNEYPWDDYADDNIRVWRGRNRVNRDLLAMHTANLIEEDWEIVSPPKFKGPKMNSVNYNGGIGLSPIGRWW